MIGLGLHIGEARIADRQFQRVANCPIDRIERAGTILCGRGLGMHDEPLFVSVYIGQQFGRGNLFEFCDELADPSPVKRAGQR